MENIVQNSSSRNIRIGSFITYFNQIISILISLIYVPIMLGKLGQSEYGIYALVQSIISYLQMTEMGIGTTATRYNSKYIASGDIDGQKTINGMFFIIYLLIGAVCCIAGFALFLFLPSIYHSYSPDSIVLIQKLFILALLNLLISLVFKIFNSVILAYEKFIFLKSISLIQTILGPFGMLLVLFLGKGSVGMLCVTTLLSLMFGTIQMIFCFKNLKISFDFKHFKKELFITIFSFTSFVFINSLATQLFSNSDKIIVSIIMNESAVAIYAIVLQFDTYFYNFTNVISGFYLPRFTKFSCSSNAKELITDQLIRTGRIQVLIAGLIFGCFISFGRQFINLWVGADYSIVFSLTLIQFFTDYLGASQSMFNSLMQAMNLHKGRSLISILTALFKLLISIVFVQRFGLYGCVIAYLLVFCLRFFLYNVYYKSKTNLDMKFFWKKMLKIYIPVSLIVVILSFTFFCVSCVMISFNSYFKIAFACLIYIIIYLFLLFYVVFDDYEKNIFKRVRLKIINR